MVKNSEDWGVSEVGVFEWLIMLFISLEGLCINLLSLVRRVAVMLTVWWIEPVYMLPMHLLILLGMFSFRLAMCCYLFD